ncbi:PAS domain S-box-containing protein [Halorientalis persicus]|uniref:histidine kinase n=1 Tax=Halorientalis persicus TaxID=1367881 RepID=A0A1H8GGV7_9EURY|nr:PAS domain S-box protein [Halorientalis persicus]SEN43213.1 PAS domain S-box-containing protein [Halorientalis persicus]
MTDPGETASPERDREWYRRLVERSAAVTLVVDTDGTVTYASPAVDSVLGHEADGVLGETLEDFVHPDDRETLAETLTTLGDTADSRTIEARVGRADESWGWLEMTVQDHRDDEVLGGALVTGRDITDRKEREADLQTTKERMQLALEGANLGIWDWDMETDEVRRDELLTDMLGYTQAEMGDHLRDWERVVHPEGKTRHDEALAEHVENRTPYYRCEYRLKTKAGDWKWVRTMGKVVERDEDGEPVRAVGIHQDIDDRKRAELALQEERDMFREGPAVVFKWEDEEGWPVTYASENVEDVLGYTPEQLQSDTMVFADIVHEDDLDRVVQAVADAAGEEGRHLDIEPYRVRTADGEIRWVKEYTRDLREDGQNNHLLGYLVDVTEQKRHERELAAREEKYRNLFEDSRDALMLMDREGYRDCNEQALDLFGVESVAEFVEYTPWALSPPTQPDGRGSKDAALNRIDEAFAEGAAFFEWTHQRVDGSEFPAEVKLSRFEHDGEPVVHALVRDISERKAQKRALTAREEKYRNLFEDTRDALMLLDRDGFFDCNEQALDLFGVESVAEFVEYTPWDLSPSTQPDGADSKEAALAHVETAFAEGAAFFEWTHQRVDGSEFPAEVKLSRFEHDGEPALHALVRDITERKEYERRLEEQRDNLDVLNQVLRHDIRNDLQLVTAYAELLADECEEPTEEEYIETVMENADHAVELTKSARQMADVMLSAKEDLQQVGLREVLKSEIAEVQSSYSEAVVTNEGTIPSVGVQANDMLASVFRNLLKNAIQHNDKEVPRVNVRATEQQAAAVVRVVDNGPGIPDAQKADIFGKGEKGLDSEGTGIGLYLVKTLVESYGGDVRVEDRTERDAAASPAGTEGATFVVELPKAE